MRVAILVFLVDDKVTKTSMCVTTKSKREEGRKNAPPPLNGCDCCTSVAVQ